MHAHVCKSVYLSALAHHSCFVFDCVPAFLQRVHNADVPFGSRVNERAGVCVCVCLCVSVCVCGGGSGAALQLVFGMVTLKDASSSFI